MAIVESPEGPIVLRAPTEAEAIAIEDKLRESKRKRGPEEPSGSLYDNGVQEVLACVLSPSKEVLDTDDGLLGLYPGLFDRMVAEVRREGGYHIGLVDCPEAIDAQTLATFKRRAVGFSYGDVRIVSRRLSWPEFQSIEGGANFWSELAALGRNCLVSHKTDEDKAALFAGRPYLAMDLGLSLWRLARGLVETKAKKSESA